MILDLTTLLTGFLGWATPTLLWEMFGKPARDRRNLSGALEAEVRLIAREAATQLALHAQQPGNIPADFSLPHAIFDGVAPLLGQLPPEVVYSIVELHKTVTSVNAVPSGYAASLARYRDEEAPEAERERAQTSSGSYVVLYQEQLATCIEAGNRLAHVLWLLAHPWWTKAWLRIPEPWTLDSTGPDVARIAGARSSARPRVE